MKLVTVFFLFALLADGPARPEAGIPFFTNVREVRIAEPERQNFIVVDEEIWDHARPDLGDLRLYDGETPVQYAISEQRAGISSEEMEARILNLGSVSGHTEFDLDVEGLAEYDRIRLKLDAHDFVSTAYVAGGSSAGKSEVELPPSTLYDFAKEQLGSNSQIKLPTSSFRYLHIRLSAGIRPQQVKAAAIYNLHEQKASWSKVGTCASAQTQQHLTRISCDVPERVPLNRILLQVPPAHINFHRNVTIEDSKGVQVASGEISRVRMNRAGTLVTAEELAVMVPAENSGKLTVIIDNGDNPPLAITAAEPLTLERRVYFDPQGRTLLRLYYGDQELVTPVYDYARFFHADASPVLAQLETGAHNPQYTGRPDARPWSEQHKGVLWAAMLLAVAALTLLAVRGLRSDSSK